MPDVTSLVRVVQITIGQNDRHFAGLPCCCIALHKNIILTKVTYLSEFSYNMYLSRILTK